MTLEEFGRFMLTKSSGRTSVPSDELLAERVFHALKKVAKDTVPLKLKLKSPLGYTILRRIDSETYIRMPDKPKISTPTAIDIDKVLLDAVALYVLAGLETQRAKTLMGLYWGEINDNNDRLTETFLSTASNDAPRFNQFP